MHLGQEAGNNIQVNGSNCVQFEQIKSTMHYPANPEAPRRFDGFGLSLRHSDQKIRNGLSQVKADQAFSVLLGG